jgi:hypothetical protein
MFGPGKPGLAEVIKALGSGPLTGPGPPVERVRVELSEIALDQAATRAEGCVQFLDIRA